MLKMIAKFSLRVAKLSAMMAKWEEQFPGAMEAYMDLLVDSKELTFEEEPMRFIDYYTRLIKFSKHKGALQADAEWDEAPWQWDPKKKVWFNTFDD